MNYLKISLLALLFSLSFSYTYAQFEMGILAGTSSTDLVSGNIEVETGNTSITIGFDEAAYSAHLGLYARVSLLGIYIEPAIILNTSKTNYRISELEDISAGELLSEVNDRVDIPLQLGIKAGILRLYIGPVAHIHLDSRSELLSIDGYSQNFKEASYGAIGGVGLDIFRFRVDVNYETNFSKFGDHITINGQEYAFDRAASRLIASIGWRF